MTVTRARRRHSQPVPAELAYADGVGKARALVTALAQNLTDLDGLLAQDWRPVEPKSPLWLDLFERHISEQAQRLAEVLTVTARIGASIRDGITFEEACARYPRKPPEGAPDGR